MIIIPAKFNSSRCREKNFKNFYKGLSLLQIAIIRSLNVELGQIIVSTENKKAAIDQSKIFGDRIKNRLLIHERSDELAKDPSTILDVVADVINKFNVNSSEKIIIILPTSPLNSLEDIKTAINAFEKVEATRLLSVCEASKPPFNAWVDSNASGWIELAFPENKYNLTQSTSCPRSYFSNGCISIYKNKEAIEFNKNEEVYSYKMDYKSSIDIDHDNEFQIAQLVFEYWCKDLDLFNSYIKIK